jgi:putative ABC transport system permease protein
VGVRETNIDKRRPLMFFRLLLESFLRQRRRKLLAGIAILLGATAVTAMLALATTIGDRIHAELAVYGANIVVTPAAANLDVKIGSTDIHPTTGNAYLHESDLAKLKTIFWANNITGISPELTIDQQASFGSPVGPSTPINVKVVGLWFDHDLNGAKTGASQLHPWWKLDGKWPPLVTDANYWPVVIGSVLAQKLNLHVGSNFLLRRSPQSPDGGLATAQVTGIVSTGADTDSQILVPLPVAQAMAKTPDAISRVEISARTKPEDAFARQDPDKLSPAQREIWYCRPYANSIAYQIQEAIPGSRAEQVRKVEQSEGTVLNRISGLMWLISAAALLAAAFAVSAAMATAILERRAEIGLMRSLGAAKSSIALLFYAETALLALIAGTLGYLLGSTLAAFLGARIFAGDAPAATTHLAAIAAAFNPVLLPVVVGLALLVAIAGSTPSIRTALRLDPAAILRSDA